MAADELEDDFAAYLVTYKGLPLSSNTYSMHGDEIKVECMEGSHVRRHPNDEMTSVVLKCRDGAWPMRDLICVAPHVVPLQAPETIFSMLSRLFGGTALIMMIAAISLMVLLFGIVTLLWMCHFRAIIYQRNKEQIRNRQRYHKEKRRRLKKRKLNQIAAKGHRMHQPLREMEVKQQSSRQQLLSMNNEEQQRKSSAATDNNLNKKHDSSRAAYKEYWEQQIWGSQLVNAKSPNSATGNR